MKKYLIILLLIVVFVSGCVGQDSAGYSEFGKCPFEGEQFSFNCPEDWEEYKHTVYREERNEFLDVYSNNYDFVRIKSSNLEDSDFYENRHFYIRVAKNLWEQIATDNNEDITWSNSYNKTTENRMLFVEEYELNSSEERYNGIMYILSENDKKLQININIPENSSSTFDDLESLIFSNLEIK